MAKVTVGSLMCGPAKRTWKLDKTKIHRLGGRSAEEAYDAAVVSAACEYGKRMHSIVVDNCHSHVALVLNELEYDGRKNWNQVRVGWALWRHGRWVRKADAALSLAPSAVLVLVVCAIVLMAVML